MSTGFFSAAEAECGWNDKILPIINTDRNNIFYRSSSTRAKLCCCEVLLLIETAEMKRRLKGVLLQLPNRFFVFIGYFVGGYLLF